MAISYANIQVTKVLTLRGNTIQNNRYTGLPGELTVDTQAKTIRIHDGVTPGGNVIQGGGGTNYGNSNVAAYLTDPSTALSSLNVTTAGIAQINGTNPGSELVIQTGGLRNFNFRSSGNLEVPGSIIPTANLAYSLGNITHQWRDLYVSNNTIYVSGVPLSIDATGNLTVNGNIIPTISYVNTAVANVTVDLSSYALNANVTAANVGMKGYVDQANTIQSSQLTSANLGIIGYIDRANTIQSAQITAANVGMKGYVDSQTYSNINVSTYLASHIDQTIGGNLTIQGNLTVNGNVTYISVNNIIIDDNIIQLANFNTADSLDLGVVAHRTPSGQPMQHTGLIRDASANQWRLFSNVVAPPGTTVDFTDAVYDDLQLGNILLTSVKNGAYTWTFGADGNLTVSAGGIITAPNAQEFRLQAKDTDSVLRNEINLDPNNGTYMSVWSDETTSFSFNDWGSGSWNNESGLGAARFTDAQTLQDFWTTGIGSLGLPIEASINGGARTPNVFYDGNNGETYGVYLGLDAVPPGGQGTTVPITSLVFYYRTQSKINIDVDGGEILLDAQAMDLDLRTSLNLDLRAGQNLNLRGLGQYPVRIYTDDTTHKWEFDTTGSLTLPREGKIYGVGDGVAGGDRLGYISWAGNSSGDGSGFNTMRLVPDLQGLEAADQYIIIDPTGGVPGHIHIRAGGTQDNSLADLYLGGENSHVKIGAGLNPPVTVMANNYSWTFGTNGTTSFPDGTILAPAGQSITMQSDQYAQLMWQNANVAVAPDMAVMSNFYVAQNSATLDIVYRDGSSNQQQKSWLWNIDGMTLPEGGTIKEGGGLTGAIRLTPAGGANADQALLIYPTAGGDGDHIHLTSGGGTTELYLGNDNQYVKLVNGGNIDIRADDLAGNSHSWTFDTSGQIVFPDSTIQTTAYTGYGNVQVATYLQSGNIANVSVAGNVTATYFIGNGALLTGIAASSNYSNVQVAAYLATATINTTGNITAGNLFTSGALYVANITTTGASGNISGANYITANYFVGNGALLTGITSGSNYSNVQVATYLPTYGGNIGGNIGIPGTLTVYSANSQPFTTNDALYVYGGVTAGGNISSGGRLVACSFAISTSINSGAIQTNGGIGAWGNIYAGQNIVATGNVTAANFVGNISITGNVTGTSANVTLQAGAFTSVFDNQGNVRLPTAYVTGNVTANYFVGNGALLTGIAASSNYSNVQVATYLPTYSGNIANIRLGVAGVLTFADGTTMTSAAAGTYSNVQVATYLPAYGGAIQSSNVQTTTANIQATTAATNTATGALRVMGGVGVAGTVFAGQLNTTGNLIANAISAYSLNTVANVVASVVNAGTINSAGNVLAQNLTGTLTTASQTNITAVGTLATLNVTGNATVGNLVGTEANTRIIANVYTTTFDIYGNVTFPGNLTIPNSITVGGNLTVTGTVSGGTIAATVYLLEAYASVTYTLPGSFTEDPCRYSVVSSNVNVSSAWFNTSTYTFTPQKAGYWEITAAYDVYRNGEASLAIKKNNSIVAAAGSFGAVVQQITKIIYLNGSTDSANVVNVGGAALSRDQYESRSWFQARWIGA